MTYTHGHHESVLRSHRWRTVENSAAYAASYFVPGTNVLDVGCGPGTITLDIARRVAPGRVIGIDASADVIEQAQRDGAETENAEFATGDIYALEFADDSFDVVHAHQVLQHVADPVQALREMARVCRPGGIVAVRDSDYLGFTWFPACRGLDRWMDLYQQAATANGGHPQAGRELLSWALEAGLTDVTPSSSTWCFATPEDRAWWGGMWAERIQQSALATQLLTSGLASQDDLDLVTAGWHRFVERDGAWLSVLHGELLIRVG
jgi:2-polyprenyl-3-methyl-5-hydroxy-6-metoxy-1,4-benzoquinol methylase